MQSGTYSPPRCTSTVICSHCYRAVWHPRWALVDRGMYQALCFPCFDRRREDFTIAAVLSQASAIVAFQHAILSGRVVCDDGVL